MEKESKMTLKEFAELVARHDLTHGYSDDNRYWERGRQELAEIKSAAANFPREEVVRIWNSEVDRKLADFAREQYYWKV